MADRAIPQLTAATVPPDGTEQMHVVQGDNSRRITLADARSLGAPVASQAGAAHTLTAASRGTWMRLTHTAAVTLTVSANVHAARDEITIEQAGVGVVTISAGVGMTIHSRGDRFEMNGQYSVASLKFISPTEAILVGDLA